MDRGRFRRIADPYHLAVAIESVTNGFLLLWLEQPGGQPDAGRSGRHFEHLIQGTACRIPTTPIEILEDRRMEPKRIFSGPLKLVVVMVVIGG